MLPDWCDGTGETYVGPAHNCACDLQPGSHAAITGLQTTSVPEVQGAESRASPTFQWLVVMKLLGATRLGIKLVPITEQ